MRLLLVEDDRELIANLKKPLKDAGYVVDVAEDASSFAYAMGVAGARLFYQVSQVDALKNSMDVHTVERFAQRLEYFTHEHENISSEVKQDFYDDLKTNKLNMDYLHLFFEKTRTSIYEFKSIILAKISVNLIKNKELTYFESNLVVNIDILNDEDIKVFYRFMESIINGPSNERYPFRIDTFEKESTYQKCITLGLIMAVDNPIIDSVERPILNSRLVYRTDFGVEFHEILDDII